ncbi:hypothetical protein BT63DRAFT_17611 [Microthyrium microscopicum]|uniref:Uncharacterized protein n=1 Tax=Microthyrium microscopicum TaxID=703497 RepID=A0A6A6UQW2_9PEZI|nr:hypothetical protein BT63DRAFT_17611 [Microthyrium microscopicum]
MIGRMMEKVRNVMETKSILLPFVISLSIETCPNEITLNLPRRNPLVPMKKRPAKKVALRMKKIAQYVSLLPSIFHFPRIGRQGMYCQSPGCFWQKAQFGIAKHVQISHRLKAKSNEERVEQYQFVSHQRLAVNTREKAPQPGKNALQKCGHKKSKTCQIRKCELKSFAMHPVCCPAHPSEG